MRRQFTLSFNISVPFNQIGHGQAVGGLTLVLSARQASCDSGTGEVRLRDAQISVGNQQNRCWAVNQPLSRGCGSAGWMQGWNSLNASAITCFSWRFSPAAPPNIRAQASHTFSSRRGSWVFGGTGVVNKDKVSVWTGGHSWGYGRGSRAAGSSRSCPSRYGNLPCLAAFWWLRTTVYRLYDFLLLFIPGGDLCVPCVCASDHVMCVLAQVNGGSTVVTRARGF